jgi:hypothetical protein
MLRFEDGSGRFVMKRVQRGGLQGSAPEELSLDRREKSAHGINANDANSQILRPRSSGSG